MLFFRITLFAIFAVFVGLFSAYFEGSRYVNSFCLFCFVVGYFFDSIAFLLRGNKGTEKIKKLHNEKQIDVDQIMVYEIASNSMATLCVYEWLWNILYRYTLAKMEYKCGRLDMFKDMLKSIKDKQ